MGLSVFLSKEVTGTQENHEAVRDAIINFMSAPANVQNFATCLFDKPPSRDEALTKITTYIDDSKMRQSTVWGTGKEIAVAATLFQANIRIF